MRWPLRKKLFVTVGGGAAAIAIVMSLMVDLTVVDQIYKYEELGLEQTRAAFQAQQKYRRSQLLERCRLISELPYFKAAVAIYDPTLPAVEQTEALATISDVANRILNQTDVDFFTLTGLDGIPLLAVGPAVEKGINDLSPIQRISETAIRHTTSDGYLVLGGGLTYVTAVRVEVGGLRLGTLCLGTALDEAMANSLEDMTGSAVALMGKNEVMAMSSGVPPGAASHLERSWNQLFETTTGREDRTLLKINRDRFRTLWLPLQGPDGKYLGAFVVMRSEDRALAFLSDVRRGLLGIAVASLIVALFFSYLFARQITNPIRQLVAFTRRVGAGDLSGEVYIGTRDELVQLGDAFNQMTRSLGESRRQLEESNTVLAEQKMELERANLDLQSSKEESEKDPPSPGEETPEAA